MQKFIDLGENSLMPWGKFKGSTIKEMFNFDLSYYIWVLQNTDNIILKNLLSNYPPYTEYLINKNIDIIEIISFEPGYEELEITMLSNLKQENGVYFYNWRADEGYLIQLIFKHAAQYSYQGITYYTPVRPNGKGMKIKNKKVKITGYFDEPEVTMDKFNNPIKKQGFRVDTIEIVKC